MPFSDLECVMLLFPSTYEVFVFLITLANIFVCLSTSKGYNGLVTHCLFREYLRHTCFEVIPSNEWFFFRGKQFE